MGRPLQTVAHKQPQGGCGRVWQSMELKPTGLTMQGYPSQYSAVLAAANNADRTGSGKLDRSARWSFCLTAARIAEDQERP